MNSIFWMLAGFAVGGISSGILCIHALRVATALAVPPGHRDDGEGRPLGCDLGPRAAARLRGSGARRQLASDHPWARGRNATFEHLHWKRP